MSSHQVTIVSLIAAPGSEALTADVTAAVANIIGAAGCSGTWLAQRQAWEVTLDARDAVPQRSEIQAVIGTRPVDVNIWQVDARTRRKALLVADMESTIIEQECLDELADYAGIRPRIAEITERAMRGELDFEAALKERVGLLAGLEATILQDIYEQRVTLMPGASTLVATMKKHGAFCALVSGGFSFFTEKVSARVGFNVEQANRLDIFDGRIAGTVAQPILGRAAKLDALRRLAKSRGLSERDCVATGDGANDLDMIKAAGLGVAFRAKPLVAKEAATSLHHGDLTGLLFLQGYSADEFVVA